MEESRAPTTPILPAGRSRSVTAPAFVYAPAPPPTAHTSVSAPAHPAPGAVHAPGPAHFSAALALDSDSAPAPALLPVSTLPAILPLENDHHLSYANSFSIFLSIHF